MLVVVSYDVPDDRRRLKLAKALKDYGERVQYSVFECHLETAQIDRMRARVERLIAAEEDSVRIYRLCGSCAEVVALLGVAHPTLDPDVYVL